MKKEKKHLGFKVNIRISVCPFYNRFWGVNLCQLVVHVLSFLQDTGPPFVHLFSGGGGGQKRVVRRVEGGRAAVSLFY